MKESNVRKGQAWEAAKRLKKLWISNSLPRKLKIRLFQSCVESVLLYAAETWSLTKTLEKRLDGAYTRPFRYALNISWKDKIQIYFLYEGISKISDRLRERRLKFAGHCFRCYQFTPHLLWILFFGDIKVKLLAVPQTGKLLLNCYVKIEVSLLKSVILIPQSQA